MARRKKKEEPVQASKLTWFYYLLLAIGLFQVYSSSAIYAAEKFGGSYFFAKKQFLFVILAGIWFFLSGKISSKKYLLLGGALFVGALLTLIATNIPGIGVTIGGATRWINLPGGFRLEPGEFYKVGFGFFIFWLLSFKEKYEEMSVWWPFFITLFVSIGLFLKQPDFGSVFLLTLGTLTVLFLWIRSLKPFLILGVIASGGLAFFLMQESYRIERFLTFLNPWKDPQGKGFQTIQSFVAFKKGGFFGEGIGMSQSKFFFLPEAHTDFTLAVFAEEMGFVGVFFLLALFMGITFSILKIARSQEGDFKSLMLSYYLGALFFFCFFINVCVNVGLVPTKGLPLPFLSYGGSSLLSITFLLGWFRSLEKEA
ncbi:MAG: peptidoglycan glycosyltransferase FtsW [Bdellovibrionales bacterium]